MMMVGVLVLFWVLAWGGSSVVNLISGIGLAALLLLAFPRPASDGPRVRPNLWGVVKLLFHILRQLVTSTALVAREVVSPGSRVRTGVIAYPMRDASPEVISTLSNAIALTPGTMTVEATTDPPVVYVHFLLLDDVEQARREIARLELAVMKALGRHEPQSVSGDGT